MVHSTQIVPQAIIDDFEATRRDWQIPGASLVFVAAPESSAHAASSEPGQGWVEETYHFGERNAQGDSPDDESYFAVASNSKLFTALSLGLLIEQTPELSWKSRLIDVLPNWKVMDSYADTTLTLEDLLAMRSGIPGHDLARSVQIWDDSGDHNRGYARALQQMRDFRLSAEPREMYQYNNYHYAVIPLLFPIYAGCEYVDFVQREIFDKVGMTDATYDHRRVRASNNTFDGYIPSMNVETDEFGPNESLGWPLKAEWGSGMGIAGPGGLAMTPRDATKWVRGLLSSARSVPAAGHSILVSQSQEAISWTVLQKCLSAQSLIQSYSTRPGRSVMLYGLGQFTYHYRGKWIASHTGGLPGHSSLLLWLPNEGFGMFLMTNTERLGGSFNDYVSTVILDHLLGVPNNQTDWKSYFREQDLVKKPKWVSNEGGDLHGAFHDPAYGTFSFSPITRDFTDVIKHLNKPYQPMDLDHAWVAESGDKLFYSHLMMTPFDLERGVWIWTAINARQRYAKTGIDGLTTSIYGQGQAVVTRDGIGMFGGFSWRVSRKEPVLQNVESEAEVWFDKT